MQAEGCRLWGLMNILGKHERVRSVPIADWVKEALDRWMQAAREEWAAAKPTQIPSRRYFHAINKSQRLGNRGMTDQALYKILAGYTEQLNDKLGHAGEERIRLAPHDMRRTFAQLAYKGQVDLKELQESLGHASVLTTERYLGKGQSWKVGDTPGDRLGIRLPPQSPA